MQLDFNIRKAKLEDHLSIAKVHITSWRESYADILDGSFLADMNLNERSEKWRKMLMDDMKRSYTFVADHNLKGIVGFISGGLAKEKGFRK